MRSSDAHVTRLVAVQITIRKRKATEDEEQQRETKLRHLMAEVEEPMLASQPIQTETTQGDIQVPEVALAVEANPVDSDDEPLFDDEDLSD